MRTGGRRRRRRRRRRRSRRRTRRTRRMVRRMGYLAVATVVYGTAVVQPVRTGKCESGGG
jgi:hypothetical protein